MTEIIEQDGINILCEHKETYGGRAKLNGERGYTHINIMHDEDHKEVLIGIQDNVTDIDGHWSAIELSYNQFDELIEKMIEMKNTFKP